MQAMCRAIARYLSAAFPMLTRCATFSHLISDQAIKLQGLSPEEVVEIDAHRIGQDFA